MAVGAQCSRRNRIPSLLRRPLGRAVTDCRGAAAVEFAIFVPLLTLAVISVTDIGLAVLRKMQVEDAAQAGAQYAIRNGFDSAAITSAVTSATSSTAISASPAPAKFCGCATGSSITTATCGTTCTGGTTAGTYVKVSAQANYYTIIDYQIVSTYAFSAESTARLQ
ncbi:TadE/TadG family type IV pilus assembly protein [Bradyrhizobium liaoningense]|uniref:TadE/TadG family type IV pilus assembly protein n=1 Tax=Bradyrhizobium liaoningense TaxID=43992 RepID=UPI001BACA165|nr:TadE/TadG family type IV pilus assembly protein [Bradyrhizobium liaoningense]MBR0712822.1 pilus assembly protein [Bradyrhizobium liaoningense]